MTATLSITDDRWRPLRGLARWTFGALRFWVIASTLGCAGMLTGFLLSHFVPMGPAVFAVPAVAAALGIKLGIHWAIGREVRLHGAAGFRGGRGRG